MSDHQLEPLSVKLYMKAGCHLCEEAEAELDTLQSRYPHRLERVDINTDAELMARYGEQIPVLGVGGREYAAPLSRQAIEHALGEAAAAQIDADALHTSNGSTGSTRTEADRHHSDGVPGRPSASQADTTETAGGGGLKRFLPWSHARGR